MRPRLLIRFRHLLITLSAPLLLVACPDDPPPPPPPPKAPTAATTAAATASATAKPKAAAEPEARPPVCRVVSEKSWGRGVNPRTGLTATYLSDGKLGIGVAFGNRPKTLMFDAKGEGSLKRVSVPATDPLAKRIEPGKGVRHLQRVTVTSSGATYADYRDKYKDGERRRISCGPTNGAKAFLLFDGKPMLDTRPKEKKKELVATKSAASAAPRAAAASSATLKTRVGKKVAAVAKKRLLPKARLKDAAVARPVAAPSVAVAVAAPPAEPPAKELREIRDCRSFTDGPADSAWSVGSELLGTMQPTGSRVYEMQFFVQLGNRSRITLHKVDLGAQPAKLHTFEAPVARRLSDGSYLLVARYRGRLMMWHLGADKKPKGGQHRYTGGYPSLPRIVPNGEDYLLLTSQKVDPTHWKASVLPLAKPVSFAAKLTGLLIGGEDASVAEPTLAHAGDQPWLGYHLGDRRRGRLYVSPVDKQLAVAGRNYAVTSSEAAVYESHLFGLEGGQLLAVYILRPKPGRPAELLSKVLECQLEAE